MNPANGLGWAGIARLGLAQMGLGAIVVLVTSTINRVMIVELALPAILPGLLVGLHYGLQLLRPRLGFASDRAPDRRLWIVAGTLLMAAGAVLAACATLLMARQLIPGLLLAITGYALVGIGVGAAGTSLLALLASTVTASRRPAAATIVWLMMIAGYAIAAGVAGHVLQPFSYLRLIRLVSVAGAIACVASVFAVWRIDPGQPAPQPQHIAFRTALREVWHDDRACRFAGFIFISMLAYGGLELVLEPFAGLVFGLPPGQSAQIASLQHGGELSGMLLVAIAGSAIGGRFSQMRLWTVGGCLASAAALLVLALAGFAGPGFPLRPVVFGLGIANGSFAVAAISAMMQLAQGASGAASGTGTRMGLFGAAQAMAFAAGSLVSSGASDIARHLLGSPVAAYGAIFAGQAALFVYAALLARGIFQPHTPEISLYAIESPT